MAQTTKAELSAALARFVDNLRERGYDTTNLILEEGSKAAGRAYRLFRREPDTGGHRDVLGDNGFLGLTRAEAYHSLTMASRALEMLPVPTSSPTQDTVQAPFAGPGDPVIFEGSYEPVQRVTYELTVDGYVWKTLHDAAGRVRRIGHRAGGRYSGVEVLDKAPQGVDFVAQAERLRDHDGVTVGWTTDTAPRSM